jgi:hypothetical protein
MKARRVVLEALCVLVAFVGEVAAEAPAPAGSTAVAKVSDHAVAAPARPKPQPAPRTAAPATQDEAERLGPEAHKRLLKEAAAQLNSPDPALILQALTTLRELRGREAALVIMERVRAGLPPQLTENALEILSDLNQPSVTPVLMELTLHRRWQIREKAVVALGALKMRGAVSALLYALDDPTAEVRTAAALALGRLGDARALPALATALEHGVDGSMLALAQLCNARHVELILKFATKDLRTSEPALRTLLARANLHISSKLAVVKAIQSLDAPEARALLSGWRESFGKGTDPLLLQALNPKGVKS